MKVGRAEDDYKLREKKALPFTYLPYIGMSLSS
jgi:hypothetical protein